MAARFWVTGGTGNWNSTTNWSATTGGASGASVPSTADTATYDASSGAGTATLDISPDVQTLTMTGFTGTLAFGTNTISLNSTGTVFTGATTMTVTGTPQIILTNNSATARTITPTAVTEANSISFRITAGTGTVSLTAGAYLNLDFTDGTNPTGYAGALGNTAITIYGSFKASTGMTRSAGATTYTFAATSGTKTINTAGVTFDNAFTFNGVGGNFQLASALTSGATRTTTLTAGTLDLNGYTLSTGLFTSAGTNTLAFDTGNITLTGTGTIFTGSTTTTVTGTPQVICTDSSAITRIITPTAVTEANSISFRVTAGTGAVTTTGGAYRNLDFTDGVNPTGFAGIISSNSITVYGNLKASTGMLVTAGTAVITFAATSGTKTIDTAGVTFDRPFSFNGVGGTFQLAADLTSDATRTCTLTNGTLDLNGFTMTTGLFSSTNSNTRTLAFGTAKIVLTATSGTIFTTSTATGLTVTGTNPLIQATAGGAGTRSITIGAAGEANAISVDVTTGSDIISLGTTSGAYKNVDFTGFTGTSNLQNSILVFGNWNYGGTTTQGAGAGTVTFSATSGTKTITSNGFSFPGNVTFNGIGGTFQLQDALTSGATRTTTLTAGTLNVNGFTLTTGIFGGTGSGVRQLITNSVPIVVTGNAASVVAFGTTTNLTADVAPTFNLNYSGSTGIRTISWGSSNFIYVPNINVIDGDDTVTTGGTTTVNDFNFTGFTGTLGNATRNIYGNLTLVSGMATPSSGSLVNTFIGVSSQTITTAGQTLDFPITFNGIGGTFAMQDALTLGSTQALTMTNGTLQLKSGTTNTVGSIATSGTNQKFLSATTPGTQATLSDASGTNSVSYLTIQDSNATGGAVFNAFRSDFNVDSGNNTGWEFGDAAVGGSGNTFAFGFGFRI